MQDDPQVITRTNIWRPTSTWATWTKVVGILLAKTKAPPSKADSFQKFFSKIGNDLIVEPIWRISPNLICEQALPEANIVLAKASKPQILCSSKPALGTQGSVHYKVHTQHYVHTTGSWCTVQYALQNTHTMCTRLAVGTQPTKVWGELHTFTAAWPTCKEKVNRPKAFLHVRTFPYDTRIVIN